MTRRTHLRLLGLALEVFGQGVPERRSAPKETDWPLGTPWVWERRFRLVRSLRHDGQYGRIPRTAARRLQWIDRAPRVGELSFVYPKENMGRGIGKPRY